MTLEGVKPKPEMKWVIYHKSGFYLHISKMVGGGYHVVQR